MSATKTRLYFSHPVSDFGTAFEAQVIEALSEYYEVVNPNSEDNQAGYAAKGWGFAKEVRASCQECAFMRFPVGLIGAGVAQEVRDFFKRGLPVWEVTPDLRMTPFYALPDNVLSGQATREETNWMKARLNGGRETVADVRLVVTEAWDAELAPVAAAKVPA